MHKKTRALLRTNPEDYLMTTQAQPSPELQAVLQHQQTIATAQATAQQLEQAIATQHHKAEQLHTLAAALELLATEREDLLADIATGQDKAEELKALDARMAQQRKDLTEQGTHAAIEQTVAGLTRKLERAAGDLAALEKQRPVLLRTLLNARAEALGVEYVAASEQLLGIHDKLSSLAQMLADQGQTVNVGARNGLQVPVFALNSVQPRAIYANPGYLVDTYRRMRAEMEPVFVAEKAALRALGVEIA